MNLQRAAQTGTGVEYFEACDRYNAAHANVALGRINDETGRFFGSAMELSGAQLGLGGAGRTAKPSVETAPNELGAVHLSSLKSTVGPTFSEAKLGKILTNLEKEGFTIIRGEAAEAALELSGEGATAL